MTGYVCIAGTGLAVMFFAALIITAYYIYRGVFVYPESERDEPDYIPDSALYHGMESDLTGCMKNMKNDSSKELSVMSYDGLRLCGRLYEGDADAPVVIFSMDIMEHICVTDMECSDSAGNTDTEFFSSMSAHMGKVMVTQLHLELRKCMTV